MKKILLIALFFVATTINAQKHWSAELGVGNQSIASECQDLTNALLHIDGVVRYSFNEKFGVGAYMGYDDLDLENYITKDPTETNYYRLSLEGVVDVTEVTGLGNNVFTLLMHGGFGATYFSTSNDYNSLLPNMSGGITGLFKINKSLALKADMSTTAHFNQGRDLGGEHNVTNVGINSFINNFTIGAVIYFGRSKTNSKEHYDWSKKPVVDNTWKNNVIKKVRDLERKASQVIPVPIVGNDCCADKLNEHIFFSENKYDIRSSELNALVNVIDYLERNPNVNLEIVGQSCYTHGSDRYNLELSKKRAEKVYNKLISMHIDANRLTYKGIGRDKRFTTDDNDAQKRVDFFIK